MEAVTTQSGVPELKPCKLLLRLLPDSARSSRLSRSATPCLAAHATAFGRIGEADCIEDLEDRIDKRRQHRALSEHEQ